MFLSEDLTTQSGTVALVPQTVSAVDLPVIVTGGIADAQGVSSVIALGAAGAQAGTAYMLCPEAKTSAVHRKILSDVAVHHAAVTNLFYGRPARGIVNRVMQELGLLSDLPPVIPFASTAIGPLRAGSESIGKGDFTPLWAGLNVSCCQEIFGGKAHPAFGF